MVNISFSDKDLPLSAAFVNFVYRHLYKFEPINTWVHAGEEGTINSEETNEVIALEYASKLFKEKSAKFLPIIQQVYQYFGSFLTGNTDRLKPFFDKHRFVCIVGIPRTGGTYLTKRLLQQCGIDPMVLANMLAHDGYPNTPLFHINEARQNVNTMALMQFAEFIVAVEMFCDRYPIIDNTGRYVFIKKATKAAYNGALWNFVLGGNIQYLITMRHPYDSMTSTVDKSGGYPKDGKFVMRSKIEEWMYKDSIFYNIGGSVLTQKYEDVYEYFWRNYHLMMYLSGMLNSDHTFLDYTILDQYDYEKILNLNLKQTSETFRNTVYHRPSNAFSSSIEIVENVCQIPRGIIT